MSKMKPPFLRMSARQKKGFFCPKRFFSTDHLDYYHFRSPAPSPLAAAYLAYTLRRYCFSLVMFCFTRVISILVSAQCLIAGLVRGHDRPPVVLRRFSWHGRGRPRHKTNLAQVLDALRASTAARAVRGRKTIHSDWLHIAVCRRSPACQVILFRKVNLLSRLWHQFHLRYSNHKTI